MVKLRMKIFITLTLTHLQRRRKEFNTVNAGLMLVSVKILPLI